MSRAVEVAEELDPVNARVRALLPSLKRLRVHKRHGPPLELVLVAPGKVARASQIPRRALHLEPAPAAEGVLQPLLKSANGEVGDINADPFLLQLLRACSGACVR